MFVPGDIFRDESLTGPEEWESGLDAWVASVESLPRNLRHFLLSLQRYMKTNQWERIEQLWDACFNDGSVGDFKPDSRAYGSLMRSFAERVGKSDRAELELKHMLETNVQPTGQVYANLMLAHWRDGHSSRVLDILEEVKQRQSQLVWTPKDVRTMMQALHGTFLDSLEFISALNPFMSVFRKPSSSSSVSSRNTHFLEESVEMEMFGYALSKSLAVLDMDSANAYAAKILESKATLFTRTIAHVASWYIARGQLNEARHFINHAVLKDRAPTTAGLSQPKLMPPRLSILLLEVSIRSSENKKDGATAVLPQFYALFGTYPPRDALALGIFMTRVLFQTRLFQEMFEVADYIEKTLGAAATQTRIFNLRMRAHIYLHQPDKALEILARMQKDHIHKPNAHTSTVLIKMTATLHGCFEARELLQSIINSIGTPPTSAYRAVITAFCKELKVDEASEIIELMAKHGLRITWNDYTPIMDVYERLNLLGKQFTLYYELLTKRLPAETPSPDLTARLILGCVRQRFIIVATNVAASIEKHHIPLSTNLVGALIELYYHSKETEKLRSLAKYAHSKMLGDGSAGERRQLAILGLYAYSYLGRPDDAINIFYELKRAQLPLNVNVFNAVLACYIKNKQLPAARHFFSRCEVEFGPSIAKQASLNSTTTAIKIMLTRNSEFEQVRQLWWDIVRAARKARHASVSAATGKTLSEEGEEVESKDEKVGGVTSEAVDVVEVEASELSAFVEENPSSFNRNGHNVDEDEVLEKMRESSVQKVPKLTLKLALSVMQKAQCHLDTDASFALSVASVCREFRFPNTQMMYTGQAQALMRLNREKSLLALFESMQASHFNMTHGFYHAVMFEATKHAWHKHSLGVTIFGYMENRKGTLSAPPNEATWHILLQCVHPKMLGPYIKAYLDTGYQLNERTLQSIARSLLLHQQPLDSAINDTFVLIEFMQAEKRNVYPPSATLTSLFEAATRDVAHKAWTMHFYHLLQRLLHHPSSKKGEHLHWNVSDLKKAIFRLKHSLRRGRKNTDSSIPQSQLKTKKDAFIEGETLEVQKQILVEQLLEMLAQTGNVNQTLPTLTPHKLNLTLEALYQSQPSDEQHPGGTGQKRGYAAVEQMLRMSYTYPSSHSPSSRSSSVSSSSSMSKDQYTSNRLRQRTSQGKSEAEEEEDAFHGLRPPTPTL